MGRVRVVVAKFQDVWVASFFYDGCSEHRGFLTQGEAEEYARKRVRRSKAVSGGTV